MLRIQELNKQITSSIEKISLLKESDINEVLNMYKTNFETYSSLTKDDFETSFLYEQYLKIKEIKIPLFEFEIEKLLENNDFYISDNFFQIKVSISSLEI